MLSFSLLISDAIRVSSRDYIIFISYIVIYFLVASNIDSEKEFNSFIKIFFLISLVVSLYTLIQYYGFDLYLNDLNSLTSTIGQKNWISNYLAMIFPVVFCYFLLEQTKKNKIKYFFLLSILYAILMICQSRGIWISISLTVILAIYIIIKFKFYEIFKRNKKWLFLLLITFLIITIIYSTDNPLNKSAITVPQRAISTFNEQDPSINTRLLMWKTTFEMIKDRPILGSGIGSFKMNYLDYQADFLQRNYYYIKYSGKAGEAHNEYLQIWAELGTIGLGIFIGIILMFYSLIINYLKKNKSEKEKIIVFGLVLGITCFLIHCLFTFPLHVPTLGSTFFILLGLTVGYIGEFDLNKTNKKNIIWKKLNQKKQRWIEIVFIFLISVCMIFVINMLVIKPYIAEIHYFKGMEYYEKENYNDALKDFKYAAQFDPYNGRILHALGTTYYHLDIQDEAQKVLKKTKFYFNDRNIFRNLGLSYMQSGNYEKAEKELKHAIYLDPKYTEAYSDLAYLYATQKDYDKAIAEWNKILEIEPNFSEKYNIFYFIGLTYQKKEMPDKALEYFLQALQLAPEGSLIIKKIEGEIYNIYKSQLEN
jgi:O-antigen ligase/Tfp pilus assembly protein PilF